MAVAGPGTAPALSPIPAPGTPTPIVANTVGHHMQAVVLAAVSSAVSATTEQVMEAFTQVSQVPFRAALLPAVGTCVVLSIGVMPGWCCFLRVTQVPPPNQPVTEYMAVRDLKMPVFVGSKSESANSVEPDYYLSPLIWTHEVGTVLSATGLSNHQQTFSIINALTGAARRSFFRAYELNFETAKPVNVLSKLVERVPGHKAIFTQKALDMPFSLNTLRDSIETFDLLVQHGELPADGSRFWHKHPLQKLITVRRHPHAGSNYPQRAAGKPCVSVFRIIDHKGNCYCLTSES